MSACAYHYHVVVMCNNRERHLTRPDDRDRVEGFLRMAVAERGAIIYAYVIMPSHVHLILEAGGDRSVFT